MNKMWTRIACLTAILFSLSVTASSFAQDTSGEVASQEQMQKGLSKLKTVSDQFSEYTTEEASLQAPIEELSLEVTSGITSFPVPRGGAILFSSVSEQKRKEVGEIFKKTTKRLLSKKVKVDDKASYTVMIYLRSDSVYFDSDSYPWAVVNGDVFILDKAAKKLLWYSGNADDHGRNLREATSDLPKKVVKELEKVIHK